MEEKIKLLIKELNKANEVRTSSLQNLKCPGHTRIALTSEYNLTIEIVSKLNTLIK